MTPVVPAPPGVFDPATGKWTIGSIPNGATETLILTATVDAGATGALNVKAEVTASPTDDPDSTPNNGIETEDDQVTVLVTVAGGPPPPPPPTPTADLSIEKTAVNPEDSFPGELIEYRLVVKNNGQADAADVVVTDMLPAGFSYESQDDSGGGAGDSFNPATGLWDVGALANGEQRVLRIIGRADEGSASETIDNTAEITENSVPDPDLTNNRSTAEVTVGPALLPVAFSDFSFSISAAPVGSSLDLRIAIMNPNATPVEELAFDINSPEGVQPTGENFDTCGEGSRYTTNGGFSFDGGMLGPFGSCAFTVPVDVAMDAPVGEAIASTSGLVNEFINAHGPGVRASLTILPQHTQLAFSKFFTNDPVLPGDTVTLEFTIDNSSDGPVADLSFTDDLSFLPGLVAAGSLVDPCGLGSSLTGDATLLLRRRSARRRRILHVRGRAPSPRRRSSRGSHEHHVGPVLGRGFPYGPSR